MDQGDQEKAYRAVSSLAKEESPGGLHSIAGCSWLGKADEWARTDIDQASLDDMYGEPLQEISSGKSTGFTRKGNTVLVSLDLTIKRDEETQTPSSIRLRACKLDTTKFQDRAPEQFHQISETSEIFPNALEQVQSDVEFLDKHARDRVREAILHAFYSPCKVGDHPHPGLQSCGAKRNVILLLPDKKETLKDLVSLGIVPYEHNVADILDVRELLQIYQLRDAQTRKKPCLGGEKTVLDPDGVLADINQVFITLRLQMGNDRALGTDYAFSTIKTAVWMAVEDTCNPSWLRIREQVDGGEFPRPPPLADPEATACEKAVPVQTPALITELQALSQKLTRLSTGKKSATDGSAAAASISVSPAVNRRPADQLLKRPYKLMPAYTPEVGEYLPHELSNLVGEYQDAGDLFLKHLLTEVGYDQQLDAEGRIVRLSVLPFPSSSMEAKIPVVYVDRERFNGRPSTKIPYIKTDAYRQLARFLARPAGSSIPSDVRDALETDVALRLIVHGWHMLLPNEDNRVQHNAKHGAHIQLLCDVRSILSRVRVI